MKRLIPGLVGVLFLACVAGCGTPKAINDVDLKQATGLAIGLAMAGFQGDIDVTVRGVAAAYAKQSFGIESAGTQFVARGSMDPGAVSPASMKAYLEAFKLLGVEMPKSPTVE